MVSGSRSHIRIHGYRAVDYREAVGLSKTRPLAAPGVSKAMSERQRNAYRTSPRIQESFAVGHQLARTGTLAEYSVAANTRRRPKTDALAQAALRKGRETTLARRSVARQAQLAVIGAATVDDYLRTAYAAGASLDHLSKTTRLGRSQLRKAMNAAGIAIRPTGYNTPESKRSRARRADATAAD